MKNKLPLFTFAAVLFFTACSQKEEANTAVPAQVQTGSGLITGDSLSAGTEAIAPAAGGSATSKTASGALNPAHGEPGHRCDISVGAPLNSAPAAGTSIQEPNASQQPNFKMSPQSPMPKPVASPIEGANPPHGQPGHRCDIPEGAPLSTPVKTPAKP
jgi:hypothetical protein